MADAPLTASILLVDDHLPNLVALEAILAPLGHRLVRATSGADALKALLVEEFAAVVLDVQMPEMDGFETARFIKARERTRHLPILFLTASQTAAGQAARGYAEGAVDFLVKPFDPQILTAKVQVFVELHLRALRLRAGEDRLRDSELALVCRQREAELREQRQALDASEERFRRVISALSEGVIVQDAQGEVRFCNDSARALLGVPTCSPHPDHSVRFEALGVDGERLDDDELPSALVLRHRTAQLNRTLGVRLPEGRVRWLTVSAQPLFDADGTLSGVVTSVFDVSEQRRNEQHLRFLAQADALLVSSLDADRTLAAVAQLSIPLLGDYCVVDVVLSDGGLRRLEVASALSDKVDPITELRAHGLSERTCERHPARRALDEGRTVVENEVSPELLRAIATDDHHFGLLVALEVRAILSVPLRAREKTLGALTFVKRDPRDRFGSAETATAEDLARRTAMAIDNGRLYSEAQAAVRLRDEFLSVASHELKTPLTPLQLKLSSLARAADGAPESLTASRVKFDVEVARRQVRKLSDLVGDLLDVSRISAGRLRIERKPLDLSELVTDVVTRFAAQAEKARCPITIEGAAAPLLGLWDRLRLDQAVTNLLSNAIKYGAGKPIALRLERRGRRGDDRGPRRGDRDRRRAPAPDLRALRARRLRPPLRRPRARPLHHPADRRGPGRPGPRPERARAGLDVHRRAARGGSRLGLNVGFRTHRAERARLGARLLTRDVEASSNLSAKHSTRSANGYGGASDRILNCSASNDSCMPVPHAITLLNVNDDEATRYTTTRVLRSAGFELREASTGAQALALAEEQPALIILDVKLPDLSGFEVCRRLKSEPRTAHIPVLHLSAHRTSGNDKAIGLDGGADGYLVQPVEPAELIAAVRALLRTREARTLAERAARRTSQLQAVTAALSEAATPVEVTEAVLRQGVAALGAYAGLVMELSEDGEVARADRRGRLPAGVVRRLPAARARDAGPRSPRRCARASRCGSGMPRSSRRGSRSCRAPSRARGSWRCRSWSAARCSARSGSPTTRSRSSRTTSARSRSPSPASAPRRWCAPASSARSTPPAPSPRSRCGCATSSSRSPRTS